MMKNYFLIVTVALVWFNIQELWAKDSLLSSPITIGKPIHAPKKGDFLYGIKFGSNYGGPMPSKELEGSWGNPRMGTNFAAILQYRLFENFSLQTELMLTFRGLEFGQRYKRDTIIDTFRLTPKGKRINYQINTFYTADASGELSTDYFELPIQLIYKPFNFLNITGGFYLSYLFGGYSKGAARIIVGEVTDVAPVLRDTLVKFDNFSDINSFDSGFMAGLAVNVYRGFHAGFWVSRSLKTFYKTISENRFYYNTYLHAYFSYLIVY